MAWTVALLHATGRPESRSRNGSKETSRSEQVADVQRPIRRFLAIYLHGKFHCKKTRTSVTTASCHDLRRAGTALRGFQSSLVRITFQRTRSGELHLDKRVNWHRHAPCGSTSFTAHLHHRHDGALDSHVMSCDASVPRCKAPNLSSERQLPTNAY